MLQNLNVLVDDSYVILIHIMRKHPWVSTMTMK